MSLASTFVTIFRVNNMEVQHNGTVGGNSTVRQRVGSFKSIGPPLSKLKYNMSKRHKTDALLSQRSPRLPRRICEDKDILMTGGIRKRTFMDSNEGVICINILFLTSLLCGDNYRLSCNP